MRPISSFTEWVYQGENQILTKVKVHPHLSHPVDDVLVDAGSLLALWVSPFTLFQMVLKLCEKMKGVFQLLTSVGFGIEF
jgi:hypothetical protein